MSFIIEAHYQDFKMVGASVTVLVTMKCLDVLLVATNTQGTTSLLAEKIHPMSKHRGLLLAQTSLWSTHAHKSNVSLAQTRMEAPSGRFNLGAYYFPK